MLLAVSACGTATDGPYLYPSGTPRAASTVGAPSAEPTPPKPARGPLSAAQVQQLTHRMIVAMAKVRTVHVNMSYDALSVAGDMSFEHGRMNMQATYGFGSRTAEVIFVNGATYVAVDGLTPPGKFFRGPDEAVLVREVEKQYGKVDPTQLPHTLDEAAPKLRLEAMDDMYGEQVARYSALASASSLLPLLGVLPPGTPSTLRYRLWVDAQSRIRRIRIAVRGKPMEMEYSDWGVPVHIKAPGPAFLVPAYLCGCVDQA
jgi:hypothetical protein